MFVSHSLKILDWKYLMETGLSGRFDFVVISFHMKLHSLTNLPQNRFGNVAFSGIQRMCFIDKSSKFVFDDLLKIGSGDCHSKLHFDV